MSCRLQPEIKLAASFLKIKFYWNPVRPFISVASVASAGCISRAAWWLGQRPPGPEPWVFLMLPLWPLAGVTFLPLVQLMQAEAVLPPGGVVSLRRATSCRRAEDSEVFPQPPAGA